MPNYHHGKKTEDTNHEKTKYPYIVCNRGNTPFPAGAMMVNIRDMTEHRPLEPMIRESELRYRRLFETAQDGILILDTESGERESRYNPDIPRQLSYSPIF